jgi:hypothetical protein
MGLVSRFKDRKSRAESAVELLSATLNQWAETPGNGAAEFCAPTEDGAYLKPVSSSYPSGANREATKAISKPAKLSTATDRRM